MTGAGHRQVHRFLDCPPAFAGVVNVGLQTLQAWIFFQRRRRQVQQPRAHHAAIAPSLGDFRQVQVELGLGLQNLEPFGVGLHQAILHAVVHHFHKVSRPGGADVAQAFVFRRGKGLEHRLHVAVGLLAAAHHQRVALGQAPDSAASAHIHELQPGSSQFFGPAHTVLVVSVAAVENDVSSSQQGYEAVDSGLGRLTGGQHNPDRAGWGEGIHQLAQQRRRYRPVALADSNGVGIGIVGHHPVTSLQQPLGHVAAHSPQADHPYFHGVSPLAQLFDQLLDSILRAAAQMDAHRPPARSL